MGAAIITEEATDVAGSVVDVTAVTDVDRHVVGAVATLPSGSIVMTGCATDIVGAGAGAAYVVGAGIGDATNVGANAAPGAVYHGTGCAA